MKPHEYFDRYFLWDIEALKLHAQENLVWIIDHPKYTHIKMLHYADECTFDNIWSEFAIMSRGLVINLETKKILAHPFDKFYLLNQVSETSYEVLKQLGGFQTSEKLDGSMILTYMDPIENEVLFTTKGSFSSLHGAYANSLYQINRKPVFEEYAREGTLIFELISKQFQIVIDYKKKGYNENLYLIGYRNHLTGKLSSYEALQEIAEELGVPTFKTYSFESLDQLIIHTKGLPVMEEGFVLRYSNDLMVKIKGEKYLEMHRFISCLSDKNILLAVSEDKDGELVEHCPDEYLDEVKTKISYFKRKAEELENECKDYFCKAPQITRKEFAEWINKQVPSPLKSFLFNLFDKKQLDKKIIYKVVGQLENVKGVTRI